MIVKICVGSSCHLKGSYEVIEAFKALVTKYKAEQQVSLQASFCLGCCAEGVTVKCLPQEECAETDVITLHKASAENAEQLFTEQVLPLLK